MEAFNATGKHPGPDLQPHLTLVHGTYNADTDETSPELGTLLAELAATEPEFTDERPPEWLSLYGDDDALLAGGVPVAFSYGDEGPDITGANQSVRSQAVVCLAAARLRRAVRQLPGLERKVLTLRLGIERDHHRHSLQDVAERVGLRGDVVQAVQKRAIGLVEARLGQARDDAV